MSELLLGGLLAVAGGAATSILTHFLERRRNRDLEVLRHNIQTQQEIYRTLFSRIKSDDLVRMLPKVQQATEQGLGALLTQVRDAE